MFAEFIEASEKPVQVTVTIADEDYLVLRQFLTIRNDGITDDRRLSFDKTLVSLKAEAMRALAARPQGIVAHALSAAATAAGFGAP